MIIVFRGSFVQGAQVVGTSSYKLIVENQVDCKLIGIGDNTSKIKQNRLCHSTLPYFFYDYYQC